MKDMVGNALDEGKTACVDCGYWFNSQAQKNKHLRQNKCIRS